MGAHVAAYPMSPVDAAWYHIDGPVNFAMVTGILLTREPLDFDKVKAVYRQRLAPFDRFRQRVVEKGLPVAAPHWEDMPGFDIGQQLHHVALPEPHDRPRSSTWSATSRARRSIANARCGRPTSSTASTAAAR